MQGTIKVRRTGRPSLGGLLIGLLGIGAVLVLVVYLLLLRQRSPERLPAPDYWPTAGWRHSTPEEQGMDSDELARMFTEIEAQGLNLHSLLIIRNGYLVSKAYFEPYRADISHQIASVTKSVTGMLVGIAVDKGYIDNINQPVLSFFPDRRVGHRDADKEALTLAHVLMLTTGFDCDLAATEQEMAKSVNWITFLLGLPMADHPGSRWYYCSPAVHLLSGVLEQATGQSVLAFANANLFGPLGIAPAEAADWPSDRQGIFRGDAGLYLTPGDMAKLGYLYLHGGQWEGKQIVSSEWVAAATSEQAQKDDGKGYGYLWTIYPGERHYAALGLGGQQVHVYPERNMVVVTTAALPLADDTAPIERLLADYIIPAAKLDRPLAANAEAQAHLEEASRAATMPAIESQPLPAMAMEISGRVYAIGDNSQGWETLSFSFEEGADTASVTVNGAAAHLIGLDGRFRVTKVASTRPLALRGHWEDDQTLIVELRQLGELSDAWSSYEIELLFEDHGLEIRIQPGAPGSRAEHITRQVQEGGWAAKGN